MLTALLAFATVTLPAPDQALAASWGALTRMPHLHGAWSVELADGQSFAGDWIVLADAELTGDSRFGSRHWIHLISSTGAARCSVGAEEPDRIYCADAAGGPITQARLDAALPRDERAIAIDTAVDTLGRLTVAARARRPTLADEAVVFARVFDAGLADALAGGGYEVVAATTTRRAIALRVRHPVATEVSSATRDGQRRFDQDVTRYETELRIGRDRAVGVVRVDEVERFTETCTMVASWNGCCLPPPPQCERLTASALAP